MRRNRKGSRKGHWRLLLCVAMTVAVANAVMATQGAASVTPVTISTASATTITINETLNQSVELGGGSGVGYYLRTSQYGSYDAPGWLAVPGGEVGNSIVLTGTPLPASGTSQGFGTYGLTLTATDAGDSSNSASVNIVFTVLGRTVIGVTEPSGTGVPVTGESPGTYTVNISSPDIQAYSPAGTVTFAMIPSNESGASEGPATDIAGCIDVKLDLYDDASCSLPGEDAGWYKVQSTYNPAQGEWFSAATNIDESYEVGPAATTTSLSQNTAGTEITATVTPQSPGAGAPTGTVQFYDEGGSLSGQNIGFAVLAPSAGGTYSTASLAVPAGVFPAGSSTSVEAAYVGGSNFGASHGTAMLAIPPIAILPTALANGSYGNAYSQQLQASGGSGSYSFTITNGSLPDGMTLSSSGLLSGSPTGAGMFGFTVTAGDPQGGTGSQSLSLDVLAPSTITTATAPLAPVTGQSYTLTATVGSPDTSASATGTLSFEQSNGSAISGCTGLTLSGGAASCKLSGTDAGNHAIQLVYSGDDAHEPLTENGSYAISPADTATSVSGTPHGFTATVATVSPGVGIPRGTVDFYEGGAKVGSGTLSGGTPDLATYTLAAPLPAGSTTSITASYVGDADFAASQAAASSVSVPPLTITPATLPYGTDGTVYSDQLSTSGGAGSPIYDYSISGGSLPDGLRLSSSGLISGTPTRAGSYGFKITANDSAGDTGSQNYSLTVSLPSVTTGLDLRYSPAGPVYGQPITLTATVTNPLGGFTPSGSITFDDASGNPITGCRDLTVKSDQATCTVAGAGAGTHAVSANYTGDDVYSTASATGQYTVDQAQTDTSIAVTGSSLSATVTATAPGAGAPTGTVDFMIAGTSIGQASLADGVAAISYHVPTGQNARITAVYGGDINFAGSSGQATDSGGALINIGSISPTIGALQNASGDPTITAKLHSATRRNRYGWYSHPVRVVFSCQANGARLTRPCAKPVTLDRSGRGQSVRRTIRATNGRSATVVVRGINIDLKSPELRLDGVVSGHVYAEAPSPRCVAHDSVSGIASCRVKLVKKTSAAGIGTTILRYHATATSRAGRRTSRTITVERLGIYLVGAPYVNGRFLVRPGASYQIRATAGVRPRYIDASPNPNQPGGKDKWFMRAGPHTWLQVVTLPADLFGDFGIWQLGVEIGGQLHQIPIAAN